MTSSSIDVAWILCASPACYKFDNGFTLLFSIGHGFVVNFMQNYDLILLFYLRSGFMIHH